MSGINIKPIGIKLILIENVIINTNRHNSIHKYITVMRKLQADLSNLAPSHYIKLSFDMKTKLLIKDKSNPM